MEDINSYFYPAILMLVAAVCYLGEFTDSIMLSMLLGVLACIAVALIKHIILLPSKKFEDSRKKVFSSMKNVLQTAYTVLILKRTVNALN